MSEFGDYQGEMDRNRTSDVEIERLLTGSPHVTPELRPIADLFAALRTRDGDELDDDAVAGFVAAAIEASPATPIASVSRQPRGRTNLAGLRRRAATVSVAATVILGGTSGLAVAADGAKPGDILYGVDRAMEAVGIGAGAESERLSEAEALINSGEVHLGLEHAAEALENTGSGTEAAEALMEAADRVRAAGVDPSAATQERVAGLLAYISDNVGNIDGTHVAELAVEIGGPDGRPAVPPSPDAPNKPGPPAQRPADPPGLSDREPGPPDHVPADPPGLTNREPGPPDVPPGLADRGSEPPGQSGTAPGLTKPPKDKP